MINRFKVKHLRRIPELIRCTFATPDWKRVIGAYIVKKELRYPYVLGLRGGGTIRLEDWDELSTFWHVFCCREYDVASNSMTIIDLGANIGAFSLWASRRCPEARIVAVEPFSTTFERLTETLTSNQLTSRIRAFNVAVGATDSLVKFDATVGKRSYCRSVVEDSIASPSIDVNCISLASLLDQCDLQEVDCLKMDVEGGEYAIIGGASAATLRRCKVITMEFHDSRKAPQLWEKLEASGFRCSRRISMGWSGLATYVRRDEEESSSTHQ